MVDRLIEQQKTGSQLSYRKRGAIQNKLNANVSGMANVPSRL